MTDRPTLARPIVAIGGGGFASRADPRREPAPLDGLVLDLARDRTIGGGPPRVCFIATATGDDARVIGRFHVAFHHRARTSHLGLFDRTVEDIEAFLLDQHAIYVGGGNTASLLAVWRAHGVDIALRRAHAAGVVLAGRSAGAICWFEAGTTDSWGPTLGVVDGGLGLVPGSCSPHYDGEVERRPTFHRLVGDGRLPDGYAADDGAALVFDGPAFVEAVSERPAALAYRVTRTGDGVTETPLPTRRLG